MSTTEHTINDALGALLRETRYAWRDGNVVSSENTGMLVGSNKRPDILVLEPSVSPVAIETEVVPAVTVEAEAIVRLGENVRTNGRLILSAMAVRLPERLKKRSGTLLQKELAAASDLEMALYTGSSPEMYSRWPKSGWLTGTVADISLLAQSASVPPEIIEQAANELVKGVTEAAGLVGEMAHDHPGSMQEICKELRQHDDEQTRRMATTILANAFVFQEGLARGPGQLSQVLSVEELRGSGTLTKSAVLNEWRKILKVNYWPIFDIARRILEVIPSSDTKLLIQRLTATADKLLENRLMRSHDLTGAVFQTLIADRKFLAAFYTTPASAALLIGLAITSDKPLKNGQWASADTVKSIRIGDLACGTGTLLSTAYQRVGQLHELEGGDSESLHPDMMANALVGCDVLPAAAHLTASMLSGAHPTVKYKRSCIMTVAFGRQADGGVALGSLDLLDPQKKLDIIAITAKAAGGTGESEADTWTEIPDAMFDVLVMNPPFTRSTGHEAKKLGVPQPMFAAFGSTEDEQKLMAKATKRLTEGTSAHGNAGEASIFLVLADRKVKLGGMLALVMPLSLLSGEAWEASRALLAKNYGDLVLVSIAGSSDEEMSFSADTGMGECLVVGRKTGIPSTRATFVILKERPAYPLLGTTAAKQICRLMGDDGLRRLEDGPVGGTPLHFGNDVIGQAIEAPVTDSGVWNPSRVADLSLAQAAYQIANNKRIWLPGMHESEAVDIPISPLKTIGEIGPYHSDINFSPSGGGIRGPFVISDIQKNSTPTYPVLWTHDAKREKRLSFDADSEAQPRRPKNAKEKALIDYKVATISATASHCHFNQNFRFNSQATAMQFTPRRTIGGRAWISIGLANVEQEKAMVVWANTTLGLLLHWYHANKQQSGRGNIGRTALQDLPVLDVTGLTLTRLEVAAKLFDAFKDEELLPFHKLDQDHVRRKLDELFAMEVLGLSLATVQHGGLLELVRMKLAQEPSVHGGKAADEDEVEEE
ncbi:MAG TPA: hypothetical protein VK738_03970 [Terriglobales bacterium]|jgi:hypothetical protein|nr:hypothetical protein [Terriglobales bacterium]